MATNPPTPPPNTIHLQVFPVLLSDDQKRLKINVWRTRGSLLIKDTNASGETGKQKRKWSETMEHAGSKHLMECPVCWANRPLQIEWNSRRLNRATWDVSPCSFSQFPAKTPFVAIVWCTTNGFYSSECHTQSEGNVDTLWTLLFSVRIPSGFMVGVSLQSPSGCELYFLADSNFSVSAVMSMLTFRHDHQ